jgi:hypothetical protein
MDVPLYVVLAMIKEILLLLLHTAAAMANASPRQTTRRGTLGLEEAGNRHCDQGSHHDRHLGDGEAGRESTCEQAYLQQRVRTTARRPVEPGLQLR